MGELYDHFILMILIPGAFIQREDLSGELWQNSTKEKRATKGEQWQINATSLNTWFPWITEGGERLQQPSQEPKLPGGESSISNKSPVCPAAGKQKQALFNMQGTAWHSEHLPAMCLSVATLQHLEKCSVRKEPRAQ